METSYEALRWLAALAGVSGSAIVAWGGSRQLTASGFVVLVVSACSWILVGLLDDEPALMSEYMVLFAINCLGIWRWGRPLGPNEPGLLPVWRRIRAATAAARDKTHS